MYIKMIIYVEKPKGIDQERRNLLELINNDSNVFFFLHNSNDQWKVKSKTNYYLH